MATEREKMLAGDPYDATDPELAAARLRARELCQRLNASGPGEDALRAEVIADLFGTVGEGGAWIEPPFYCDYGSNIFLGRKVFMNFNCVILDTTTVRIGDNTLLGPAVQIYAATHPMSAAERRLGVEFSRPVEIGADVWIAGGVVICPGVTIGDRAVIGAGSVVTRDIPADTFAAGNPCRVIREIPRD